MFHLWAGWTLQASLAGRRRHPPRTCLQPWEAASHSCPSNQEHLIHFYWLMCSKVNEKISAPPSLKCINCPIIQTVALAIPTWCSCLRKNHIEHERKGRKDGRDREDGFGGVKGGVMCTCQVPAIFRCCHTDQSQPKWGSWESDIMTKLCQTVVSIHIVGPVSAKKGF